MNNFTALEYADEKLRFIDQTKLPFQESYVITDDYERIAEAIERLEIRGAPAIGIAAAYAIALAFKNRFVKDEQFFSHVFNRLKSTRPTAVNLFWALNEMKKKYFETENENIFHSLIFHAMRIHDDDKVRCNLIGEVGLNLFKNKINVLTHCNTGTLATGGEGTALNVIKKAFANGFINHVYADETRPLLQGSRLTAFELNKLNIPFTLITDSMAAFALKEKNIGMIIVGADRIAKNGDTANKIGTYGLSVLAAYHNIPFYVAAPESTIDRDINSGSEIKIEFRTASEINSVNGCNVTDISYNALNPAFDVTPSDLISGIITEKKIYNYPYNF
jgi:methylthioribose-1-phosphate isomerase